MGWNFREHIKEMVRPLGRRQAVTTTPGRRSVPPPILFLKPPSSLIGHGDAIVYPVDATRVEYEGELAVVIARDTRRVTPEEAQARVLGWTCANDVTERDLQSQDKQWWRAKGYDTFAVAGPFLETEAPGPEAWIRTRVNGEVRQEGQVQRHDPRPLRDHLPRQPGDDPATAATSSCWARPPGVGELHPGDEVEVEIDGVGYLRNPVRLRGE